MSDSVEQVQGEFFPHRALWVDAINLCDLSESIDSGSAYSCSIGALITISAVLEGFANFIGEKLRPEIWENERKFFSGKEFRGTLGKLTYIANEVDFKFDTGARPFQTLLDLIKRRNSLVHNRIDSYEYEVRSDEMSTYKYISDYYHIAAPDFLKQARVDVEEFCDALQKKASSQSTIIELRGPALRSYVGHATGTLKKSE